MQLFGNDTDTFGKVGGEYPPYSRPIPPATFPPLGIIACGMTTDLDNSSGGLAAAVRAKKCFDIFVLREEIVLGTSTYDVTLPIACLVLDNRFVARFFSVTILLVWPEVLKRV